jgi:hypothetical protein
MLATLTAIAAQGPTPRVSSPRAANPGSPLLIRGSIDEVSPDFSPIAPFLFAALVVFAVYRRLRRTFGRQPLRPGRMTLRIVILAIIAASFLPLALRSVQFMSAELVGAALGIALGLWGAQRTRFQMYSERLHYLPHTYTGIAVSLLFLGRLVFRFVQLYSGAPALRGAYDANPAQGFAPATMMRSPLTVALFFVLVGYYVCYYGLVLWKSKHLKTEDIEVSSTAT